MLRLIPLVLLSICSSLLLAQEGEKLVSGPKPGDYVPAPFECLNVSGPSKGRPSCLVCRFALSPSVLIFAKEPMDGKDEAFNELLKQLDEAALDFDYRNFSVGVIILSPEARDSTNNVEEKDTKKLIDETVKREMLVERLTKRAEPVKNVLFACHLPEGPKKYAIHPKAELTIVYYDRMKITDNWTFGAEGLKDEDVKAIVKRVRETLPLKKKVEKT